jgi:prepilin-type N-terminal cleavage/methylation domain-containing protein
MEKGKEKIMPFLTSGLRPLTPASGFTLVEMAMVIVIIGLVMLTVFPALNAVRTANQRALTQTNLRSLMLATAAYVQANGCLPCPANASFGGTNFGRLGYTAIATACGTCSVPEGIAPFVALGVPASTARDGWGFWITMRVDPALTSLPTSTTTVFVPPTALCSATDATNGYCTTAQAGSSSKGLCKSGLATANRIAVTTVNGATQQAAVIFVSHGATGYGSFFAQPVLNGNNGSTLPFSSGYAACSASGGYAQCNGRPNTTQFYDSPSFIGDNDSYDDILAYADRNTLVSMLGNGGCATTW